MTVKKPLLGNKSVEDKLKDIESQSSDQINYNPIVQGGEILKSVVSQSFEVEKVMKQYRLKKETRGVRVDLDEDLHAELKITCIRLGTTQEEFLIDLITNAVKKEKKRFDI